MKSDFYDGLLKKRQLVKGQGNVKAFPNFDMLTGMGMGILDEDPKKKKKTQSKKSKKRQSKRAKKKQTRARKPQAKAVGY